MEEKTTTDIKNYKETNDLMKKDENLGVIGVVMTGDCIALHDLA